MIIKVPIYVEVDRIPQGGAATLSLFLSKKLTTVIRKDSIKSYFSIKDSQYLSDTYGELKTITREKALDYLRTSK